MFRMLSTVIGTKGRDLNRDRLTRHELRFNYPPNDDRRLTKDVGRTLRQRAIRDESRRLISSRSN